MNITTKEKRDPLLIDIERALACGEWIDDQDMGDYNDGIRSVKRRLDRLVKAGEAKRAVHLYELFLIGCEGKMKDIHGEGLEVELLFKELFISWVHARQAAKCDPGETICQMLRLMDHDDYGLCSGIEENIARSLKGEILSLFVEAVQGRLEKDLSSDVGHNSKIIYDRPVSVRNSANILRVIFEAKRNLKGYLGVCERVGFTPKDCEVVANIFSQRRRWNDALEYVERGLRLEQSGSWPNYSAHHLVAMKCALLNSLGRSNDALQTAWNDFLTSPREHHYEILMLYVPGEEKAVWHANALAESQKAGFECFLGLCLKTKELEKLAEIVEHIDLEKVQEVYYGTAVQAAELLSDEFPRAAIKIYRALGLQIVKEKRSKCYSYAIGYFKNVRDLSIRLCLEQEWSMFVNELLVAYKNRPSFISGFMALISGRDKEDSKPSLEEQLRQRWEKKVGSSHE